MERDVPNAEYHDFAKIQEGGICPKCGKKTVKISRGIEVGNIFQLGTKYTLEKLMKIFSVMDADQLNGLIKLFDSYKNLSE